MESNWSWQEKCCSNIYQAFDTISYELLPFRLQAVGVMSNSYNWMLHYLKDTSQFNTVICSFSSTKPINYKVLQGSLLGPYSINGNDLSDTVTGGELERYAYDPSAHCIGDNIDTVILHLNLIFEQICGWSRKKKKDPTAVRALTLLQTGEIELCVFLYQLFVHICEHICGSVIVEVVYNTN